MHSHQHGVCPVCNGTGRVPAGTAKYKEVTVGYDKSTDTLPCRNCGGQTMSMKATGKVRLRPDGTPCEHKYVGHVAGRCYVVYTCEHCGDTYDIDSGD
jgi:hypothetical protein